MAEVEDSHVLSRLRDVGGDADQSLLVLLALGRLAKTGDREMPWSVAEVAFADMVSRFRAAEVAAGGGSTEVSAARAFLGLSHDHIWGLDVQVPTDRPRALNERRVSARLDPVLERALRGSPGLIQQAARTLAVGAFPGTDPELVLAAVGLDARVPAVPPTRAEGRSQRRGLDAYLKLTVSEARTQFNELLVRGDAAEGKRQVDFISVETLLCLAASFVVNHRRYGGSTAHTAPTPIPELARLFKRRPSSVLAKMANLDGSRSHGASHDASAGARLREDPTLFTYTYRVLLYAARAEGIGAGQLPDFLDLEEGGELDLLGQEELATLGPDDLRAQDEEEDPDPETERIRLAAARVGQHLFAQNVLANCGATCVFCGLRPGAFGMRRMLMAGHIKPWRDSTSVERLDTRNGLAACPAHDVAFDTGLLTVADDLTVLVGEALGRSVQEDEMTRHYYGQPPMVGALRLPPGAQHPLPKYLAWHRRYIFR
ncbi:MAG: endonuclease [Actinomycetia bacterium]|nr:endonuclease [Actinomycetes bacterium]